MPSISWQWKDYWEYFNQIEEDKRKTVALQELNGNGWLARLSAELQAEVFRHAPEEILLSLKHFPKVVKVRTLEILQKERDKQTRRTRR